MKPMMPRVLVIEDDSLFRYIIRGTLERSAKRRCEVTLTECLKAGLEYLASQPVDIVLLDLNLPESLGTATLKRVRQESPEIPIIVLTGLKDEGLAEEVLALGAREFLGKSEIFGDDSLSEELVQAIERVLGLS